ncbi:tyrosine-type recombinase/integrase [Pseudomonas tolaasii]|uniref:tyrosine-type recombinase/integrase n=1 Tax=Pseudomonas tolaasii TaxID=29442 RepID=UPI0015A3B91D|nr:tyrosine-type recombinase/integrase [Pseudomonas tolaasii]NWE66648.1 tyrosine-type recombinase/integrase [Pseudomonas tolaasii]
MALTDTAAKQAKPRENGYTIPDSLGLSLYVAPSGVKSWHFRFTWLGKQVRISIGTYPETGLKEARARRDEAREDIANGVDPRDSRREKKAGMIAAGGQTFRRVYDEWLAFRKGSISPGTYRVISNAMALDVLPTLGDRQIDAIKRADVIALIRRVEKRGSVATAVKVRQRMSQVFSYAIAIGVIEANPTAEMHAVTEKMGQHKPHPFLPFSEMPRIMAAIRDCASGQQLKAALMLMIYTASRPGEVRHAEWSEIDLDAAIWTTPAAKMKMRRDHAVPLSTQAIAILESMLPITGDKRYVFINRNSTTAPIGTNYANNVMDSCGLTGIQSPHGFRHLFSTEMNGRGYNRDWIERQLAHADSSFIRDVYNHATYLDQRRGMMQEWANLVSPGGTLSI